MLYLMFPFTKYISKYRRTSPLLNMGRYLQYDWNKIVAANAATLAVKSRPIREAKHV